MKSTFVLYVVLMLAGCDFGYNYEDEAKWSKWAYAEAPLSEKEIKLIDSLAKINCPIEIKRTFIGRNGTKKLQYQLIMQCDSLIVTQSNKDSIDEVRRSIINELYVNVISDSVLFDMTRIETQLNIQKLNIEKGKTSFTLKDYFIDSLASLNGFKVIKTSKNNFKRVKVH